MVQLTNNKAHQLHQRRGHSMRFLRMPLCSSHPDTRFHFGSHTLQKRGWAYSWKLPKGQGIFRISEHIIFYMFESYLWMKLTHTHSPNVPSQGRTKVARKVYLQPNVHWQTTLQDQYSYCTDQGGRNTFVIYVPWRPHWKGSLLTWCPEQQNNWWTICRKQISLGLDTVIPYWTMFSEHTDKRTNLWTS